MAAVALTDPARHRPVLLGPALDALAVRQDGFYVDATFGRGGHSSQILARLGPTGRLLAVDRDPEAVAVGAAWTDARFEIVHARFSALPALLRERAVPAVDGLLLDLGVSSPQLDSPERGFSFRGDGPLDMRMDPTQGISARDWLLQASEARIGEVLREYGEERFAGQVARAIVAGREQAGDDAFRSTGQLAAVVAGAVARSRRRPELGKDPATRTFQALRILVNQELEELAGVLDLALDILARGGRLVVISFHSLEDRIVKQFMRRLAKGEADQLPRDLPIRATVFEPSLRLLGKPVYASDAELAANPRARSAVMRVAEKLK